eukprot:Pgem_evm1s6328
MFNFSINICIFQIYILLIFEFFNTSILFYFVFNFLLPTISYFKPIYYLCSGFRSITQVSDFGMSEIYEHDDSLNTFCGTYMYSAPEMLLGDKYAGTSIDVWSLGVTLVMMCTGKHPFESESPSES